jgi:UDP-glucose 4-epimerase
MNWLITGGCGFIGRSLITDLLAGSSARIRVYDNLSVGTRDDLAGTTDFADLGLAADLSHWTEGVTLIEADILDANSALTAAHGADVMVHLAANTGVAPSVENPHADALTNVIGTLNMLEAARHGSAGRFVFASSGAPLGVQTPPLHEDMAPHPASPYGASKLAGEGYCSAYFHCFGVETVALRFGNVYGEGSGHKNSVVAKFIKQAMAADKLEIYGDGGQTRDFIHISDLVQAIRKSAQVPGVGGECFQIATAKETTVTEMTEQLLVALVAEGVSRPETFFGPLRDGDVLRNFSDTSKAQARLGWQAQVGLEDGLRRTVRFFVSGGK